LPPHCKLVFQHPAKASNADLEHLEAHTFEVPFIARSRAASVLCFITGYWHVAHLAAQSGHFMC